MSTRIIELVKSCSTPLKLNAKPGDTVLIITDTAMDPVIWQALMAAAYELDCRPVVAVMSPLPHHGALPPPPIEEAMKTADITVSLTSKEFHQTNWEKSLDYDHKFIIMEQNTIDTLTGGAAAADYKEMYELGRRIVAILEKGHKVHVASETGTDFTVNIDWPGKRTWIDAGICVPPPTKLGKGGFCAFPGGECGITAEPETGEGVMVWDTSCQATPGLLKEPIKLIVKKGRVVEIEGGAEAKQLREYIGKHGDENTYMFTSEIAIGINKGASFTGFLRIDKKVYGKIHTSMGDVPGWVKSKLHIDGITAKPTLAVDGKTIIEKGKIYV